MDLILADNTSLPVAGVLGGREPYQGARREWLEFLFPQEGHTLEALEAQLSPEATASLTIQDDEGERYLHTGYVLRGPARVYQDESSGTWMIGLKRYQRTEAEAKLDGLMAAIEKGLSL